VSYARAIPVMKVRYIGGIIIISGVESGSRKSKQLQQLNIKI